MKKAWYEKDFSFMGSPQAKQKRTVAPEVTKQLKPKPPTFRERITCKLAGHTMTIKGWSLYCGRCRVFLGTFNLTKGTFDASRNK